MELCHKQRFLRQDTNSRSVKEQIRLYQNLKLVLFEIVLREWEDKSHSEDIFASHISGKGHTCRIYKEL